jgi:hypothetical protein
MTLPKPCKFHRRFSPNKRVSSMTWEFFTDDWRNMHWSRAPSIAPGTFFVAQPWADCITNMPGFNLRQAQLSPPASTACVFATMPRQKPLSPA